MKSLDRALRDPLPQSIDVDVVSVGMDAPLQTMLAGRFGLPDNFEPHHTSRSFLVEHDFSDDEAQNALPFSRGRGGGVPDSW